MVSLGVAAGPQALLALEYVPFDTPEVAKAKVVAVGAGELSTVYGAYAPVPLAVSRLVFPLPVTETLSPAATPWLYEVVAVATLLLTAREVRPFPVPRANLRVIGPVSPSSHPTAPLGSVNAVILPP